MTPAEAFEWGTHVLRLAAARVPFNPTREQMNMAVLEAIEDLGRTLPLSFNSQIERDLAHGLLFLGLDNAFAGLDLECLRKDPLAAARACRTFN